MSEEKYQQITADEAQEGDLVRIEYVSGTTLQGRMQVGLDGELCVKLGTGGLQPRANAIYLIDRPSPPKIPADAGYVMWWDGHRHLASRTPHGTWRFSGFHYTVEEFLEVIGDAEVTVLVPKAVQS